MQLGHFINFFFNIKENHTYIFHSHVDKKLYEFFDNEKKKNTIIWSNYVPIFANEVSSRVIFKLSLVDVEHNLRLLILSFNDFNICLSHIFLNLIHDSYSTRHNWRSYTLGLKTIWTIYFDWYFPSRYRAGTRYAMRRRDDRAANHLAASYHDGQNRSVSNFQSFCFISYLSRTPFYCDLMIE